MVINQIFIQINEHYEKWSFIYDFKNLPKTIKRIGSKVHNTRSKFNRKLMSLMKNSCVMN